MNGIGKSVISRMENNIFRWNKETTLKDNDVIHSLGKRLVDFISIAKLWVGQIDSNKGTADVPSMKWSREYWDNHFLRPIIKVDSHQLNEKGNNLASKPRYTTIVPNLAIANANHWADVAAEKVNRLKKKNFKEINELPSKLHLPDSNLRFFLTWERKTIDKNTNKFIQSKLHAERKIRLSLKQTQGLGQRILPHTDVRWNDPYLDKGWFRAFLGLSNTHTRSFYKALCYRIGTIMESRNAKSLDKEKLLVLQNSILINGTIFSKDHHLLYCTWCDEQKNKPIAIKLKLGKNLKGNRRHACFFCKNSKLKDFRDSMDEEIENTCRKFLKLFDLCGSSITSDEILIKIQNLLLRIQGNNTGRLKSVNPSVTNYLSIQGWCSFFDIDRKDIRHKLLDINIHSHIFGFGTALGDGELSDDTLGVVDCIHTGAFPKDYDKLIESEIKKATIEWRGDDSSICLKEKLTSLWKDIKNLVLMKFKGIHNICNTISKEMESNFKKLYNLNRRNLIETRSDLISNKRKFEDIEDDEDVRDIRNTKKRKAIKGISLSDLWSKPRKCLGLTCGNEKNYWNCFTVFKPNWLPLEAIKCDRCSRYINAMKKASATLINLRDNFMGAEENFKQTTIKLLEDSIRNMNDLSSLFYRFFC